MGKFCEAFISTRDTHLRSQSCSLRINFGRGRILKLVSGRNYVRTMTKTLCGCSAVAEARALASNTGTACSSRRKVYRGVRKPFCTLSSNKPSSSSSSCIWSTKSGFSLSSNVSRSCWAALHTRWWSARFETLCSDGGTLQEASVHTPVLVLKV